MGHTLNDNIYYIFRDWKLFSICWMQFLDLTIVHCIVDMRYLKLLLLNLNQNKQIMSTEIQINVNILWFWYKIFVAPIVHLDIENVLKIIFFANKSLKFWENECWMYLQFAANANIIHPRRWFSCFVKPKLSLFNWSSLATLLQYLHFVAQRTSV